MAPDRLCNNCRSIDFRSLLYQQELPSECRSITDTTISFSSTDSPIDYADIAKQRGRQLGQQLRRLTPRSVRRRWNRLVNLCKYGKIPQLGSFADEEIPLGNFDSLIQRSVDCKLCALIVDAVMGRNGQCNLSFLSRVMLLIHSSMNSPLGDDDPLECSLNTVEFCYMYRVPWYNGTFYDIEIHRLNVSIIQSPFKNHKIKLQAVWGRGNPPMGSTASGRQFGSTVDMGLLRSWLRLCEERHGEKCSYPAWLKSSALKIQPQDLKVIDVLRNCIVDAPPNCRYLALSYVWGNQVKSSKCTTRNIHQLRQENGLTKIHLTKTILDSMTLVAGLGERYLWVDALCITQDDRLEVTRLVKKMDLVYGGALATIIAAADVDAGLPGIREGSRAVMDDRVKVRENLSLVQTATQSYNGIQSSRWNSRGWTFQERLLSRRVLIFTKELVFWNCETSDWDEETILEPENPKYLLHRASLGCYDSYDENTQKFTLNAIPHHIRQYSSRNFTYAADALPAFLGIIQRTEYRTGERFHWGLMCTRFDQSLAWQYGQKRRNEKCDVESAGGAVHQVQYPSWSWLGWEFNPLLYPYSNSFGERLHARTLAGQSRSELDFYLLMSDGSVRLIEGMKPISGDAMPNLFTSAIKGNVSSLEGTKPTSYNSTGTKDQRPAVDHLDCLRRQWKGSTMIFSLSDIPSRSLPPVADRPTRLSLSTTRKSQETPNAVERPVHDTGRLAFWTSHAKMPTLRTADGEVLVHIGDSDVKLKICGTESESLLEKSSNNTLHGFGGPAESSVLGDADQLQESEIQASKTSVYDDLESSKRDLRSKSKGKESPPLSFSQMGVLLDYIVISRCYDISGMELERLNLLLIKWSDTEPNVARRIGIVQISERDWIRLARKWIVVILE